MQIVKNSVVSLTYEMFNAEGELIDKTQESPLVYLHGGYDGIFPLVEEGLHGKKTGDQLEFTLESEDAFGDYDPELVREEPADVFPEEVTLGMMFETDDPETGDILVFTVTAIENGTVTIDANHPLAGQSIRFVCTVAEVRPATAEEIEHGHVHGEGGHHHH